MTNPLPDTRSVLTGKQIWLSASGIGTWRSCPRSWWYAKVAGLKRPATPSLAIGLAVHDALEQRLKTGEWPQPDPTADVLPLAQAGLEHLERLAAIPDAQVECTLRLPAGQLGPLPFFGRVDWTAPLAPWPSDDLVIPQVSDHKTTKNLKAPWLPDATQLRTDVQLCIYAGLLYPDAEQVRVGHIYYQTEKHTGSRELHAVTTRTEVQEVIGAVVQDAHAMGRATQVNDPEGMEYRRSACRKYGGCPHALRCSASPVAQQRRTAAITTVAPTVAREGNPMGILDSLGLGEAAATTPPPQAAEPAAGQVTPPDAPPTETPTQAMVSEAAVRLKAASTALGGYPGDATALAMLQQFSLPAELLPQVLAAAGLGPSMPEGAAGKVPDTVLGGPKPDPQPTLPTQAQGLPTQSRAAADLDGCKVAVLAFLRDPGKKLTSHKNARPVANAALGLSRMGSARWDELVAEGVRQNVWESDTTARGTAILLSVDELPPEPGEQADAGTETAQEAAEPIPGPSTSPDGPEAPSTPPPAQESAESRGDLAPLLLVGCIPLGMETTTLDAWVAPAVKAVEAREGVDHYGLVDYAKGPAMVAGMARVLLHQGKMTIPDALFCPAYHPLTDHIVDLLSGAALVVRGVR